MRGQELRMAKPGDVIIEFYRIGGFVKVSAIDPHSLVEVSIVGAPEAGEEMLARAAMRKLKYVMARQSGGAKLPRRSAK